MADQTAASLRVRVTADIADIKQGLALLQGEFAKTRTEAGKAVPLKGSDEYVKWWQNQLAWIEQAEAQAKDTQVFESRLQEARKLQDAAEYVQFWERELASLDAAEAAARETAVFDQRLVEARKLQEAAEYVQFWERELASMDEKEAAARDTAVFDERLREARKLQQSGEYVQWWNQQLDAMEAQEKRLAGQTGFLQQLQREADAIGKTRSQLLELKAAELGVSDQAAPLIARLKETEKGLGASGKSARELAMVMPQITDIVTSLQGGMPFTTVLLQQGGQLRDVFGGVTPALKAVGAGLMAMVTPATLTVAALAAVGYAWYSSAKQAEEFDRAIAATGNRLGTTRDELEGMAEAIAGQSSVASYGDAAKAIQSIAAAGDVSVGAMQNVALSIVNMSQTSGASIDSLIGTFAKLSEDSLAALDAVDKKTNILTFDLYEQVKSLVELGRNYEAAAVIAQAAADKTAESLAKVDEALDGTTKMVHTAESAWHSFYIGLKQSLGMASRAEEIQVYMQQIASLQQQSTRIGLAGGDTTGYQVKIREYTDKLKALGADSERDIAQARQQAQAEAADRQMVATDKLIDSQASREVKKRKEIATFAARQQAAIDTYAAQGDLANWTKAKEQLEAGKAAIEKKYADKKTPSTANTSRNLGLQQFEDAADVEKARVEAQTKVLQAQYQARGISASEYYAKLRALTVEGTDAQAGALEKEIAYLKARAGTGKDAIATTQKIGELEAKLATVRSEGAAKVAVLDEQEAALKKQREDAIRTYKEGLDQQTQALQSEMDAMVAHVGAGDREYEIRQRIAQIYAKQAGELKRLADARVQAGKDTEKLSAIDQQEADLRANTEQQVSALIDGYQRLAIAQGEWSNGAKAAWANYLDDARNVAGTVQDALTSAFKGGEDAFVQFVKTSKLSFSSLADSIIEDMARIAYKQAASGIGSWLSSLFGGYSAPSASFASGFGNNTGWLSSGQMGGYASGGYTGDGGKFDPAGIVHKGEGVVPQWGIAAMGGPAAFMGFLGTLRSGRGYADGGVAGIAAAARTGATAPKVEINIENNSNSQLSAQAGDVKFDGEKWVIKIVAANIASGGAVAAAGKGRFGWKDQL